MQAISLSSHSGIRASAFDRTAVLQLSSAQAASLTLLWVTSAHSSSHQPEHRSALRCRLIEVEREADPRRLTPWDDWVAAVLAAKNGRLLYRKILFPSHSLSMSNCQPHFFMQMFPGIKISGYLIINYPASPGQTKLQITSVKIYYRKSTAYVRPLQPAIGQAWGWQQAL